VRYLDEFRDSQLAKALADKILAFDSRKLNFMEVCGTHTVTILKSGIKELLKNKVNLISGPGCPVCVTSAQDMDKVICIASMQGVVLATFGDMLKVPGRLSSLEKERAKGGDIRVIYSSLDAIEIARRNPHKKVVFLAVGFETTSPTTAYAISLADKMQLSNFFILCLHKVIPPAIKALLDMGEINQQGFICPGHVSTIIGSQPYQFISQDYKIPCVITGFEPTDILQAILMLLTQQKKGESQVMIQYKRGVSERGNPVALDLMNEVFDRCDARWRGIGTIPGSGLRLAQPYKRYDVETHFDIPEGEEYEPPDCLCGQILRGVKEPANCKQFGKNCDPNHPMGPCMVSLEGSCAAYYYYGRTER
jgi:hydrogenase expression/formation protein HypD